MSNSLDPDQARHFVGLGMGPNCLRRLSADDTRRQRLNMPDFALNWLANNVGQDQSVYADQGLRWQPLLKEQSHYIVALSPNRWVWMVLTLSMLGNFSCLCCRLLTFFKVNFLSGTLSECQTVWIQIRTNIMSVLIWIQTVCKVNQQTTKFAKLGKS